MGGRKREGKGCEGGKGKGEVEGRDRGKVEGGEGEWDRPPTIFGLNVALIQCIMYVSFTYLTYGTWSLFIVVLQDIVKHDDIKLDWFFKLSLLNDLVNVSVFSFLLKSLDFILSYLLQLLGTIFISVY